MDKLVAKYAKACYNNKVARQLPDIGPGLGGVAQNIIVRRSYEKDI
jgi:hypothetical protein